VICKWCSACSVFRECILDLHHPEPDLEPAEICKKTGSRAVTSFLTALSGSAAVVAMFVPFSSCIFLTLLVGLE